mmetsp:Transcript_96563/g.181590  ORF Transcript_96563/g.181590 Transcript_96563/m.181590 type:complete len:103 (+) Transcript_96563:37-345(+)
MYLRVLLSLKIKCRERSSHGSTACGTKHCESTCTWRTIVSTMLKCPLSTASFIAAARTDLGTGMLSRHRDTSEWPCITALCSAIPAASSARLDDVGCRWTRA